MWLLLCSVQAANIHVLKTKGGGVADGINGYKRWTESQNTMVSAVKLAETGHVWSKSTAAMENSQPNPGWDLSFMISEILQEKKLLVAVVPYLGTSSGENRYCNTSNPQILHPERESISILFIDVFFVCPIW